MTIRKTDFLARLALVAAIVALGASRPAAAWESKGHALVNQLAAEAMPAETPAFFKNAVTRLAYLGPEPDRWKSESGPQLRAVNNPDHYMDMEPVLALTLPGDRYKFIRMVDEKVAARGGLTGEAIGFLPYRIAEMTQTLQSEWRDWQEAKDAVAKAQIEQDIIYTAGVLGHYVADGSNPLHTTVHFNGWDTKAAPNPNGYTTAETEAPLKSRGFHGRFEGDFVEAAIDAKDVRPLLAAQKPVGRVFDDAVAYLKVSNTMVPKLYDLEKRGAFNLRGRPDAEGLRFTQERLAAGASMLRDIWASAMKGTAPYRRGASSPGGTSNATSNGAPAGTGNGVNATTTDTTTPTAPSAAGARAGK